MNEVENVVEIGNGKEDGLVSEIPIIEITIGNTNEGRVEKEEESIVHVAEIEEGIIEEIEGTETETETETENGKGTGTGTEIETETETGIGTEIGTGTVIGNLKETDMIVIEMDVSLEEKEGLGTVLEIDTVLQVHLPVLFHYICDSESLKIGIFHPLVTSTCLLCK